MGRATLPGLLGWVLACGACAAAGAGSGGGGTDAGSALDAGGADASPVVDARAHQELVDRCALLAPERCPAPHPRPSAECDDGLLAFARLDAPPADWTLQDDGFHSPAGPMSCDSFRRKDVCAPLPYAPELCRVVGTAPCPPDVCPPDPWVYPPDTRAAVVVSATERCAATGEGLFCGPSGAATLVVAGSFRFLQLHNNRAVLALGDGGLAYYVDPSKHITRLSAGTDDFVGATGNGYAWAAITRKGNLVIGEGADAAACAMSEHAAFLLTLNNYLYFATTEGTVGMIQVATCTHLPEPIRGVSAQYCGITAAPVLYGATHAWFPRVGCAYD
jgi:hypothetical protein